MIILFTILPLVDLWLFIIGESLFVKFHFYYFIVFPNFYLYVLLKFVKNPFVLLYLNNPFSKLGLT